MSRRNATARLSSFTYSRTLRVEPLEDRRLLSLTPELVADIAVGASAPDELTAVNGMLYFSAFEGSTGRELWKSDGTAAGTVLVKNLRQDIGDEYYHYNYSWYLSGFTRVGNKLYFASGDEYGERAGLWSSDGTEAGTVELLQLYGDHYASPSGPFGLTDINGVLYFAADDWGGAELWRSDQSGTRMVADIVPGIYQDPHDLDTAFHYGSNPTGFTELNGQVLFSAYSEPAGWTETDRELWRTDGTTAGTVRVKDIAPGSYGSYPSDLTRFGDQVFFFAREHDAGFDLWTTDTTANGTTLVHDLPSHDWDQRPQELTQVGENLFFTAFSNETGRELWSSDGTDVGTKLLFDVADGATGGDPAELTRFGNQLAFSATNPAHGRELWLTDGTEVGTRRVSDIRVGSPGANPRNLTPLGNLLFFTADDGVHGEELWVTDGTDAGTYLVADIHSGSGGYGSAELAAVDQTLFFTADDGIHGRELWKVFVDDAPESPPRVRGVVIGDRAVNNGQVLRFEISELALTFNKELRVGDDEGSITNLANWNLRRNGVDITGQISAVDFVFNESMGRFEATLRLRSPLKWGDLQLTLRDSVVDLAGNRLDGDADGAPQGDYSIDFSVFAPQPVGGEFRVNTFTAGDQRGFPTSPGQIAMAADGSFVVTWSSVDQEGTGDEIYFQRYDAAGLPVGPETRANSIVTGSQRNSTIAAAADGSFVVAWNSDHQAANGYDIYARRFNALGVPLATEFRVNYNNGASAQRSPVVTVAPDGAFAVVWHGPDVSSNGIFASFYQADGAPVGRGSLTVNQFTTDQQQIKSATLTNQGRLIVVWQSDGQDGGAGGVYARIFESNVPLTNEIMVHQTTAGSQQNPTVAADAIGRFLVTWTSDGQDGDAGGIYARRFDIDGQPLTDEFRVNETTAGAQRYSTIAMDDDGDYLITWSSAGQDGDGDGIYARRYNAAGQAEGHEFRVNSFTPGNQIYSSPALDDDGDFVVVWSSQGQDGSGYGVYGQRYAFSRPAQPGDTNDDGAVDIVDLNNVRNYFGATGDGVLGDTAPFDGVVDIQDLNAVRNNFGAGDGAPFTRRPALPAAAVIDLRGADSVSDIAPRPRVVAGAADVLFTSDTYFAMPWLPRRTLSNRCLALTPLNFELSQNGAR